MDVKQKLPVIWREGLKQVSCSNVKRHNFELILQK
jgi:hypothetical protein